MRRRTFAAFTALVVVDFAVLILGYRAHTGSLPPLQRSAGAFEVTDLPTAEPTATPADDDTVIGPVLLGVNAAGDVLRATRGACEEQFDNQARIWTGNVGDGERLALVELPGIREVLGLIVYAKGKLRVSGLDDACDRVTFDSDDGGASWQASPDSALWRLSGDTTANTVINPLDDEKDVPCPGVQMVNLPKRRAIAACSSATYSILAGGEVTASPSVSDYDQLSVTAGPTRGSYVVFGTTQDCLASVGVAVPDVPDVDQLQCFNENKAPLAIASAGDLLVVQLGNDLRVSRDGGATFDTVGEPSADETSAAAS
jgi:hypothetical protein